MATETTTRLVDDLDGSKAERTVDFSWDGRTYSIDLSRKNIAALQKSLQPYIGAARVVAPRRRPVRGKGQSARRGGSVRAAGRSRDLGAVRAWARAHGYEVRDRGRISAEIVEAYDAAR